jgi:hypothetical protein
MRDGFTDNYRLRHPDDQADEDAALSPMRAFFGGGRRSTATLAIVVIVVLLIALHHRSESAGSSGSTNTAHTATIGQTVTDDHLEFDVTKVRCDVTLIGTAPLDVRPARGHQWCVVSLTVSTTGSEEVQFYDADQYVYTSNGNRLSDDVGAAYFLRGDRNGAFISPGTKVAAQIPFEVPDGQHVKLIELHDSGFSAGAVVRV